MATPFAQIDKTVHDEMSCTYAALILHDEGIEITSEKINKLIAASGNKVDAYWPGLFARALHGRNVSELLLGGGGGSDAAAGGAQTEGKADAKADAKKDDKKDAKKETKKEPVKEEPKEEDIDMGGGLGLFDEF